MAPSLLRLQLPLVLLHLLRRRRTGAAQTGPRVAVPHRVAHDPLDATAVIVATAATAKVAAGAGVAAVAAAAAAAALARGRVLAAGTAVAVLAVAIGHARRRVGARRRAVDLAGAAG